MAIPFIKEFDDYAEAMAVPNPNRPIQEAAASFGRRVCDAISARPGTFAPTILQSPLKAACQPYWDSAGYDGPEEDPPFTGGQCAGVNYRANGEAVYTLTNCSSGEPFPNQRQVVISEYIFTGPVVSVTAEYSGSVSCGQNQIIFRVVFDGGAQSGTFGFISNPVNALSSASFQGSFEAASGPDNCGDPPGDFIPGTNPAPDPGPLPPGTGPIVNVRGDVILVLPPTLEVSPNFSVELPIGEINLGSGTGNSPAEEPLAGEEGTGAGSGAGGGDNDFGEPPDGERWCGACVTITQEPLGVGNIPQAEPESIYPRTIGNVRLKFRGPAPISEYDTPIVNRQKTTCVWEPVRGLQPIGVRVNLLPGYSYSYRPYSIPQEQ